MKKLLTVLLVLMMAIMPMNAVFAKECTHIPCNNTIVKGGINHIIAGNTCYLTRYSFYKCACCGAIIGMVPNSGEIVGTHPAH